jgi:hypothetical protein
LPSSIPRLINKTPKIRTPLHIHGQTLRDLFADSSIRTVHVALNLEARRHQSTESFKQRTLQHEPLMEAGWRFVVLLILR